MSVHVPPPEVLPADVRPISPRWTVARRFVRPVLTPMTPPVTPPAGRMPVFLVFQAIVRVQPGELPIDNLSQCSILTEVFVFLRPGRYRSRLKLRSAFTAAFATAAEFIRARSMMTHQQDRMSLKHWTRSVSLQFWPILATSTIIIVLSFGLLGFASLLNRASL